MQDRFSEFTLMLANTGRAINRIKNIEMEKYGLKGTQVNCIFYLYKAQTPLSAKDICSLSDEDKGAVSRTLKELEQKGYVVCQASQNKKRYNAPLQLTLAGQELARVIIEKIEGIIDYDQSFISEQELADFYQTFNKIYSNLKSVVAHYEEK